MFYSLLAEYTYFIGCTINVSRNKWQAVDGQNTKLAFVLYKKEEDQHQPPDAWSSHIVTIHVLVRTFAVRVRHQARFRMQKFQVNDLIYLQESSVCLLELLEQTVHTIIIINCLHLLQGLSFLNNHSVVVK